MRVNYETLSETEWEQVNQVWDLLDQGQVERARLELKALERKRPGHPDLRIVDAAVSLDEGEAEQALDVLKGAERSADPALFFHLRAVAQFELARFVEARDDAERAIAIRPELAETHHLLARVFEHLGDSDQAREHAEEAQALDPESFALPIEVSDEEFDQLVEKSVRELPPPVRKHLEELPLLVEPIPRREILTSERPPLSPDLLGLFVGRDLLERTHADLPGAPGAIFLFRRNLLRVCADREELEREIRITVQHEVGHLLGLDEDDLEQWGLA
jgi:predicted Zn-dependent protease with MMP-like domain